jgi:poly-gamma-glutamate capsule biosynthesis protein CapA/YwtB (metallophosphatase superfamily)
MTDNFKTIEQEVFTFPYERIRYEAAQFPFYDIRSIIRYVLKYRMKKYSASQALIKHFLQTQLSFNFRTEDKTGLEKSTCAKTLKISMVGDIMWMRKGWNDFISDEVMSFLSGRDIVLGNLETPVSAHHAVIEFMPDIISFNSPPSMLDHLAQCFTAVSIVNNHCLDQGASGLYNTIRELDSRNILYAGARVYGRGREYAIIMQDGWKIAFLAYAWGVNNIIPCKSSHDAALNIINFADPLEPIDYSMATDHVRRAREDGADLVICSLHWGYEFEMYPTFHMMNIARSLISIGVDVIMGHHPHVLQPFEIIDVNADRPIDFQNIRDKSRPETRKAVIAYSLGNFISAMYTKECLESCVLNMDFVGNKGTLILDAISYLPTLCLKKQGRTKVFNLVKELKNEHPSKLQKRFTDSYRGIERHLGSMCMDIDYNKSD